MLQVWLRLRRRGSAGGAWPIDQLCGRVRRSHEDLSEKFSSTVAFRRIDLRIGDIMMCRWLSIQRLFLGF
jgi:hypothetical protein